MGVKDWIKDALPTLGNLAGDALSYMGNRETNAANAAQARAQMDFQREMSNTSYQRATEDMKKAGLNPALGYSQGGASTPQGSKAEMTNGLNAFKGSAQAVAETYNSLRATSANIAKTNADTKRTDAETNQLNIESAARLEQIKATAALTGTNARFAQESYNPRLGITRAQESSAVIDKDRKRLDYMFTGDSYQREKDVLWPLAVEQLRQNLTNSITSNRDTAARATLNELSIPTAQNMARAASTSWGRNIAPFLNDAQTVARMLSIGAQAAYTGGIIK